MIVEYAPMRGRTKDSLFLCAPGVSKACSWRYTVASRHHCFGIPKAIFVLHTTVSYHTSVEHLFG